VTIGGINDDTTDESVAVVNVVDLSEFGTWDMEDDNKDVDIAPSLISRLPRIPASAPKSRTTQGIDERKIGVEELFPYL
jgi:hypothetical protein